MTASLVQVPTGSCFGVGRRREGYPVCAADAIGERERIGRRIVGAPGHVPVRPHQHQAALIEPRDRRIHHETNRAAVDDQDRRFDRHAAWTFVRNLSTSARRLAVCLPI
jgi:hypothetical protein